MNNSAPCSGGGMDNFGNLSLPYRFALRVLGTLSLFQSLPDIRCINTDIITRPWLARLQQNVWSRNHVCYILCWYYNRVHHVIRMEFFRLHLVRGAMLLLRSKYNKSFRIYQLLQNCQASVSTRVSPMASLGISHRIILQLADLSSLNYKFRNLGI